MSDHPHGNTRERHPLGRSPDGSGEPAFWNEQLTKPGQCSNEMGEKHQGPTTERSVEAVDRQVGLLRVHLPELNVSEPDSGGFLTS